jgi:adenosylhomocysteine nucleosidase
VLGILTGLVAEARLAEALGQVVAGGGTRQGALDAAFPPGCTALLSFGLAGGLDPSLPPGTLVIPNTVITGGRELPCDPALLAWLGGATVGAVADAPGIVATLEAKQLLWRQTGAAAVDMESGPVALRGLPFAVLRAVCDPGDQALPPAALVGLDAGGGISVLRVVGSVLRDPRQIGGLLRLARHAAAARRGLRAAVGRLANQPAV